VRPPPRLRRLGAPAGRNPAKRRGRRVGKLRLVRCRSHLPRSRSTILLWSIDEDRAHYGAEQARGSLELGRHLVDACLGAVVVLARRPGHANRTDHVVADLNRQTTG
jgi:hypothetical protein